MSESREPEFEGFISQELNELIRSQIPSEKLFAVAEFSALCVCMACELGLGLEDVYSIRIAAEVYKAELLLDDSIPLKSRNILEELENHAPSLSTRLILYVERQLQNYDSENKFEDVALQSAWQKARGLIQPVS